MFISKCLFLSWQFIFLKDYRQQVIESVIAQDTAVNDFFYQKTHKDILIFSNSAEESNKFVRVLGNISKLSGRCLRGNTEQFKHQLQLVGQDAQVTGVVKVVCQSTGIEVHLPSLISKPASVKRIEFGNIPYYLDDFTGGEDQLATLSCFNKLA